MTYGGDATATLSVVIALERTGAGERALVMPRAVPMGYSSQPYDRFVKDVRAFDRSGQPLKVARAEGPRWRLGDAQSALGRVEYQVDLREMEGRILAGGDSSRARAGYAYLLGYSVAAYVDGLEGEALRVTYAGPPAWPVCATLAPAAPCGRGRVLARAADFYALADSQVLMGERVQMEEVRTTAKAPLFVALYAESELDRERLTAVTREAYELVVEYFGGVPFSHYTAVFEFLTPVSAEHSYGFSMEHLQSASFCLPAERALTPQSDARALRGFRVNVAHHMAHAWVPKRAYGQGYFPFSWEVPPAHDSIWFSEGFGQYAAIDTLADELPEAQRAEYREAVVELRFRSTLKEIPRFILETPLVDLSYRGSYVYSEDFRVGRTLFSRGGLMAAEMDARIRERTKGAKRLRDALRQLVAWSAKNRRAFRIEELPGIFAEATGVETRDILERWLGPVPAVTPPGR
jgi:predicted metalloprotease with PDZ domain